MRAAILAVLGLSISVAGVSCGGGGGPSSSSRETITDFRQLALDVQSAAMGYQTQAEGATSVSACQGVHDAYDGKVRPWIARMKASAASMDDFMHGHDGAMVEDMGCVSGTMMTELDRHHAFACASSDLTDDEAEISRHVTLMSSYAGHLLNRCDEMLSVLNGAAPTWGTMMQGCEGWHDTGTGNGTMHDGHMGMMLP